MELAAGNSRSSRVVGLGFFLKEKSDFSKVFFVPLELGVVWERRRRKRRKIWEPKEIKLGQFFPKLPKSRFGCFPLGFKSSGWKPRRTGRAGERLSSPNPFPIPNPRDFPAGRRGQGSVGVLEVCSWFFFLERLFFPFSLRLAGFQSSSPQ